MLRATFMEAFRRALCAEQLLTNNVFDLHHIHAITQLLALYISVEHLRYYCNSVTLNLNNI